MVEALHICKFFGTKKTFQYKALILFNHWYVYQLSKTHIVWNLSLNKSKWSSNTSSIPMNAAAVLHNRGQQTSNLCALQHQLRMCGWEMSNVIVAARKQFWFVWKEEP